MVGRAFAFGKAFESRSIHKKNVGPSVVVVVEDRDTGAGGFNYVFLRGDSAKDVAERQPSFFCEINKIDCGLGSGGSGARTLRKNCNADEQNEQPEKSREQRRMTTQAAPHDS